MPARNLIASTLLIATVVGASLWFQRSSPQPAPVLVRSETEVAGITTVHVSGAVVSPGLVEIAAGSRVADAVAAAGGTTREADLAGVNLAAPVQDGQQVVIPKIGDQRADGVRSDGKMSLNAASAAELEQLPGVGPVLAERIAAYRDEHGPFTAVEDLLDVSGIGEAKLETLRDGVVVP